MIQRFSPSQIWKNYRIGAGVARDATKNSLVGALQGKIKRNFRFSGFYFFSEITIFGIFKNGTMSAGDYLEIRDFHRERKVMNFQYFSNLVEFSESLGSDGAFARK